MDTGLHTVQQPLDLVRLSLNNKVRVKLRYGRHLTGTLVVRFLSYFEAYDAHLNMLLHNVKEKMEKEVIDELLKHKEIKVGRERY